MITAVTTCMGRREHLETTLPLMLDEFDHVIVVDWSCPQNSGLWAKSQGADIVTCRGHDFFSASRARNAGARAVRSRSVCFIDADTMCLPGLRAEVESLLNLRTMVVAARRDGLDIHDLGGFLAVDIGHFWGVKGYNEELQGYALEDCYLRAQLCLERELSVARVSRIAAIRHSNELRGRHHKDPIGEAASRNYGLLTKYLEGRGISNWLTDSRTAEIAYKVQ